jgi:hypothetical protein
MEYDLKQRQMSIFSQPVKIV